MSDSTTPSTTAPDSSNRRIGLIGACGIGVGAIVGGGVLALAGVAFAKAGPSAIIAFLLNGGIAYITAMSFAEMATAFPENGGAYAFTRKVLSVRAAFAVGWILWFASIAAAVLYALGFSAFAITATRELWSYAGTPPEWLGSRVIALLAAFAAVGFYTLSLMRTKGSGGNWETLGKLIVFGIIIIAGGVALVRGGYAEVPARLHDFAPGGLGGIAAAMGYTFIALQGFDIIAAVAGEVKEPRKNLPRSMFYSLAIALVVYIPLLFVVSTVGVPAGTTITEMAATAPETMIATAVRNFMGPLGDVGFWLVMIAAILSMLSALAANLLAASRIAYAMAGDRTLPRFMSRLSPKTGTPVRAILVSVGIILLILLVVPDVAAAGAAASLIFLLSFTLTHVTAYLARTRGGVPKEAFRTPLFPLIPVIGGLLCASLALYQGIAEPAAGVVTSLWLGVGFLLYFTSLSDRAEVVDAGAMARDPSLVRLRGRSPLVLVPLANPKHARAMVETANALTPPAVGRVLLLSVVRIPDPDATNPAPVQLQHTQDVLREALTAATERGINPEALVTIAHDPWEDIRRVVGVHRCESLLLGLSGVEQVKENSPLEHLIQSVDCDVVVMGAPDGWTLSSVKRVLVPVGGAGSHDRLRARLLNSLCRFGNHHITYLRVVAEDTPDRDLERLAVELRQAAEDEIPIPPDIRVLRHANPAAAVAEAAAECDLVLLGMAKRGAGHPAISPFNLSVAAAAKGATILISHHD